MKFPEESYEIEVGILKASTGLFRAYVEITNFGKVMKTAESEPVATQEEAVTLAKSAGRAVAKYFKRQNFSMEQVAVE